MVDTKRMEENESEEVFMCKKCRGIEFNRQAFESHKKSCSGSKLQSECKFFVLERESLDSAEGTVKNSHTNTFDKPIMNTSVLMEPEVKVETVRIQSEKKLKEENCVDISSIPKEQAGETEQANISTGFSDDTQVQCPEQSIHVIITKQQPINQSIDQELSNSSNVNCAVKYEEELHQREATLQELSSFDDGNYEAGTSNEHARVDRKQPLNEAVGTSIVDSGNILSKQTLHNIGPMLINPETEPEDGEDTKIIPEIFREKKYTPKAKKRKIVNEEDGMLMETYKSYKQNEIFQRRSRKFEMEVYKCQDCNFTSPQVALFHLHMTVKHAKDVQKRKTNDKRYRINRPPSPKREFSGEEMSRRAYYTQRNLEHEKRYAQYKNENGYDCPVCSWTTKRGVGMFHRHVTNLHAWTDTETPHLWKCNECAFETNVSRKLTEHKRRHERPFVCTVCSRGFITKKNLSDHMLLHTGETPLKCDFEGCNYSTIQKRCLDEHKRKHTGERLMCDYCSFTTIYIMALRTHINMKHREKERYRCDHDSCQYVTNDRASFIRHSKIHMNEKDFKCCLCDYRSVAKHQVVMHLQRVHNQEKTYACDRCSFTTGYTMSLRYHLMAHMGIKPFKCSNCQYSSVQKVKIVNHIGSKHSDDKHATVIDQGFKFDMNLTKYRVKLNNTQKYYTVMEKALDGIPQLTTAQNDLYTLGMEENDLETDSRESATFAPEVSEESRSNDTFPVPLSSVSKDASSIFVETKGGLVLANSDNGLIQANLMALPVDKIDDDPDARNVDSEENVAHPFITAPETAGIDTTEGEQLQEEPKPAIMYSCSECDFLTPDYDGMTQHVTLHRGMRLYQCPQCGYSSQQLETVEEHVVREHDGNGNLQINEISMSLETDAPANEDTVESQIQDQSESSSVEYTFVDINQPEISSIAPDVNLENHSNSNVDESSVQEIV